MSGDMGKGDLHGRKIDPGVLNIASFVPKLGQNHRISGTHGSISGPKRRNFVPAVRFAIALNNPICNTLIYSIFGL